jgi:hypothetical protein
MKFMRKTAKYTWQDHKRDQEIMKGLKTNHVLEILTITKKNGSNMSTRWRDQDFHVPS